MLQFGFGPEVGFDDNQPPMENSMANGTVGKKCQIIVKVDGEVAGPPTFASSDATVVEVREEEGVPWAYQLTQGSAEIRVNQPLPGGKPDLVGAGLLVINDPADDATIVELEFGSGGGRSMAKPDKTEQEAEKAQREEEREARKAEREAEKALAQG